ERKTGRTADFVDHPAGMHDDVANACAGALVEALNSIFGDVLGYLQWEQSVASGAIRPRTELQPAAVAAETVPPCPQCNWQHTTDLGFGGQRLCTACATQFLPSGASAPEVLRLNRANLEQFAGTKTTMNPRGFERARSFWQFLDRRK